MPRFFVSGEYDIGQVTALIGEDANHVYVLRMRPGEQVTLSYDGYDYDCELMSSDKSRAEIMVRSKTKCLAEPKVNCSLFIAHAKSDKVEHVIMKAVELGAYEIIMFSSKRCVSKPDDKSLDKKLVRWNRISQSAAEQSGRGIVPKVKMVPTFADAVHSASQADKPLFLYESEKNLSIKSVLDTSASNASDGEYKTVSIVTGPEGGFEISEAKYAQNAGMKVINIGPRILRCETAPLAALSAVMFHSGNF